MPLTIKRTNPTSIAANNFQFARRASTLSGKSVLFDGTNDYLSLADSANLRIGTSAFCIEAWIYLNTLPVKSIIFGKRTYNTTGTGTYYFLINSNGDLQLQELQNVSTIVNATAAIQINTWYHVAVSRDSSNNVRLFVNGTVVSTATSTFNFSSTEPLWIGKDNAAVQLLLNGYISNLRFVIGNPVYTSSFAPSTTPLTAIANTALLTCNAATIVDSSTNNFTITNNNSATVSSVSPFVASSGGMSLKKVFADPLFGTQKAIFGYGNNGGTNYSMTNLVSNAGVVATDTAGVGTARQGLAAAGYGTDKAIFGYGRTTGNVSMTNLVSNTGVVATDISGVGTARYLLAAAGYGSDKAIFGYGYTSAFVSITNLVSNTGVVSTDTTGVGTARHSLAATGYGTDKAIFGYGYALGNVEVSMTNLVSNTGVVAANTTGVGTARNELAAAGYGTDKAIFGYGSTSGLLSITNLVSNTGVVSTNTTGVGTAREQLAAASYAGDKSIFGYGYTSVNVSMTNLVSNTGVVATDTTGVGTARYGLAAAGFSLA